MKNITINGQKKTAWLEKELSLCNGALVLLKHNDKIEQVYMVVSFRDNKNRYQGDNTAPYCTLVNLDNGSFAFEERCSRKTTVRRTLNHLLRLGGCDYSYNASIPEDKYGTYDVEIKYQDEFTIDISI